MLVLKFGGTSVANATNIRKTTAILQSTAATAPICAVVSALSGVTDALIQCGTQASEGDAGFRSGLKLLEEKHLETVRGLIVVQAQSSALSMVKQYMMELESVLEGVFVLNELSLRTKDRIMAFGELLSSRIISAYLDSVGVQHQWQDARDLIKTDDQYGNAHVLESDTQTLIRSKVTGPFTLIPGFIASDRHGHTTTLGRGGSDYTGAIVAAGLDAERFEVWTDVSGMMTADPRLCTHAKVIPQISYQEAMELSHFGAKVLYPPTIQPVMRRNIPVWIKNTFAPGDEGTRIQSQEVISPQTVCGLSSINKMALLQLEGSGMIGIPGFSRRLFGALAAQKVNVILITQSSSEHSICVGVEEANASLSKQAVDEAFAHEISLGMVQPLVVETGLSIVALVGDQMKSHPGISGKMFSALGKNGVNIRAIAQGSSEKNISAVVKTTDVRKAVNVLHEAFFEATRKQLNLFIVGTGNVGGKLLAQLERQREYLQTHLRIQAQVVGLANSRQMVLNEEGISLNEWPNLLKKGEVSSLEKMVQFAVDKNLRNSIFIDNTGSTEVPQSYATLLQKSIAVVACNKVAASSNYDSYRELKELATEFNTRFLFETNVGAGLPVINTLQDLRSSGDEVHKIKAVLSGTLNFVFNHYDGTLPFHEVVRQAQTEGFTEPDPRLDLGGTDVMRKILILAREAGYRLNMEDIANPSFLPPSCFEGTVEDFYKEMEKHESHFRKLFQQAQDAGCRLKFVAELSDGKASVGLQHIEPSNDLYHLYGKDNVVLFYTQRYTEQPLVIKGAGAGADVTASGIFADIIRAAR
jgi:bifunctional aspartokinase / homoserine dehydrogenase 1